MKRHPGMRHWEGAIHPRRGCCHPCCLSVAIPELQGEPSQQEPHVLGSLYCQALNFWPTPLPKHLGAWHLLGRHPAGAAQGLWWSVHMHGHTHAPTHAHSQHPQSWKSRWRKSNTIEPISPFQLPLQASVLLNTTYINGSNKACSSTYNSRPTSEVVSSKKPFHEVGSHRSLTP